MLAVLPKRFARYGPQLHPEKTRLVPFQRPPQVPRMATPNETEPGHCDFLVFPHFWGRSRQGRWVMKRKTASDRFGWALRKVRQWCRQHRHDPLAEQQRALQHKLQGHDQYCGITGNSSRVSAFHDGVARVLRQWLKWRVGKRLTWEQYGRLRARDRLPGPRMVHSVRRVANP
ncbi:MAG: hypothetical protein AB1505_01660 [Candidatus Latescibacterota bacterium]